MRIGQTVRETLEADLAGEHDARKLYIEARQYCDKIGDYVTIDRINYQALVANTNRHPVTDTVSPAAWQNMGWVNKYRMFNKNVGNTWKIGTYTSANEVIDFGAEALLVQPDFVKLIEEEKEDEIKHCIGCGTCSRVQLQKNEACRCVLNSQVGRKIKENRVL